MSGKTSHNVFVVNDMATLIYIVTINLDTFVVGISMTHLNIYKIKTNLPNVLYAVARIQQIIKVVQFAMASTKYVNFNLQTFYVNISQIPKHHHLRPISINYNKLNSLLLQNNAEHTSNPQN